MGQSTDAILFYGIDYGDDFEPELDENYEDFEDMYAAKMGVNPPSVLYSEDTKPIFSLYWKAKHEILSKAKCDTDIHCSYSSPMRYVYVKESRILATRGNPRQVPNSFLRPAPDWDDQLKEYCELMRFPYEQPKWILASFWEV